MLACFTWVIKVLDIISNSTALLKCWALGSCRFRRPTLRASRVTASIGSTAGQVLPLAEQALVDLESEQGDLGFTEVIPEEAAGEADLLAAAGRCFSLGAERGLLPDSKVRLMSRM